METTWKTPHGWVVVRDALTMGPREHEDQVTVHTRPPADDDADHMLVRTVTCTSGRVEVELICEPMFDYGNVPAEWVLVDDTRRKADAHGAGVTLRLQTNMALGIEGTRARARHTLNPGEQVYCSLSWAEGHASATDTGDASRRIDATATSGGTGSSRLDCLTIAGEKPSNGLRCGQGPDVHADRRGRSCSHYILAGDARGRTQLGLPIYLDERRHVYSPGTSLDAIDWEAEEFMQFVADLEPNGDGSLQIMYGIDGRARSHRVDPRAAVRLCRRSSGPDRQWCVRSASERRFRCSPCLDLASYAAQPTASSPVVADCRVAGAGATAVWQEPDQGIWEARGKPQHYVSSKLMCWVAMDRAAKLAEIRGDGELAVTWQQIRRGNPNRH